MAAYHGSLWTNLPPEVVSYQNMPIGDSGYLKEAATNFPNDPRVQWAVLADPRVRDAVLSQAITPDATPEYQRQWLDAFKASSPDNPFPNYLSALGYFTEGKTSTALEEIAAATGKEAFNDFASENRLDLEQLYLEAGKTRREASWADNLSRLPDLYTEMGSLKNVAYDLSELQKTYQLAGDTDSAKRVVEWGLAIANQLNERNVTRLDVGQLTGISIEALMLGNLDQNQAYDFLGGRTPAERLKEVRQQRDLLREQWRFLKETYPTLTDDEWAAFNDRRNQQGESEAIRWLKQQRAGTQSPDAAANSDAQ